jgi:hypothetical protein
MRRSSAAAAVPFMSALIVLALGCIDAPTAPRSSPPLVSADEIRSISPAIRFESLLPGDAVAVHFESRGCFHFIVADLILTRKESGIGITVVRATGNGSPLKLVEAAGRIDLEKVRGLDHVLEFYRGDRPSSCTTVDRVTFRVLSGALRGVEETYADGSCWTLLDSRYYPVAGLLRFTHDSALNGAT